MRYRIFEPEEAKRRVTFSNNLRYIINNGPLGQAALAKKIGVSQSMISAYARGKTYPNEERIREIADALGCTVDNLFDEMYEPVFDNK